MPELNDCYALAPKRSAELAERFLDHFLPTRQASFAPEDPSEVLGLPADVTIAQVLRHLEENQEADYSMYFHNCAGSGPRIAGVFFRADGSLLFLVSIEAEQGDAAADQLLDDLKGHVGAQHGYWAWESPPAESAERFMRTLKRGTTIG